jgi:hypothetical protein
MLNARDLTPLIILDESGALPPTRPREMLNARDLTPLIISL